MKTFLILVFSFLFIIPLFGQETTQTQAQIDSLLKGDWKSDSTAKTINIDCGKNDQIYIYGMLDPKHMDWFIIFKFCTVCKRGASCPNLKKGTDNYLQEFYSNDPRMTPRNVFCFRIGEISKKRLTLYMLAGTEPCKVFSYSRIDETAPAKKKKRKKIK